MDAAEYRVKGKKAPDAPRRAWKCNFSSLWAYESYTSNTEGSVWEGDEGKEWLGKERRYNTEGVVTEERMEGLDTCDSQKRWKCDSWKEKK